VIVPGLEGAPRNDVDSDAEEFFKILEQADMIKKGGARFEVHEQVQVAVWASLAPGDGAEHRDPMSLALPGDAEDLRAAAAQPFQGHHVIGHSLRVSPHAGTAVQKYGLGGLAAAATHTTGFPATAQLLGQGAAVLVLAAYTTAVLLTGAALLRHRDITA